MSLKRRLSTALMVACLPALLLTASCDRNGTAGEAEAQAAQGRREGSANKADQHQRGGPGQRPPQPAVPVAVEAVSRGSIASYYSATATLQAEAEAQVLARVSGVVQRIGREEGDQVDKGAALLQIENEEYLYRLQQAEAKTANLRSRFERLSGMVEKKLVSEEEFDTARSDLASAEADEGLARLELGYTTVTAPFTGRITERLVDVGQNVNVGTPLFVLADFDPLLARVHVPSKEFGKLSTEQAVTLVLDSDGSRLEGRIKLISPVIDPNSGTIKVTVEIPHPPAGVRPGDFTEVRIMTERRDDRVLVPRGAVITDKGDDVLYVARDGIAERRVVEIGLRDDEHAEIIDGVTAGEEVIVKGQRSLTHGAAIRVLGAKTESARPQGTRQPGA